MVKKMTIKTHSGTMLHAKLRNEPTVELKGAYSEVRKGLAAKLKETYSKT